MKGLVSSGWFSAWALRWDSQGGALLLTLTDPFVTQAWVVPGGQSCPLLLLTSPACQCGCCLGLHWCGSLNPEQEREHCLSLPSP